MFSGGLQLAEMVKTFMNICLSTLLMTSVLCNPEDRVYSEVGKNSRFLRLLIFPMTTDIDVHT